MSLFDKALGLFVEVDNKPDVEVSKTNPIFLGIVSRDQKLKTERKLEIVLK